MRYGNPSKKTRVHASVMGHSVSFPGKGSIPKDKAPEGFVVDTDGVVYVPVPALIAHEVASIGMLAESEIEEPEDKTLPARPVDPAKLQAEVFMAFGMLKEANDRESFAGTGIPKVQAVEKLLGYNMNGTEVKDLWGKFLLSLKDGE